jgi:hypothetical protein
MNMDMGKKIIFAIGMVFLICAIGMGFLMGAILVRNQTGTNIITP